MLFLINLIMCITTVTVAVPLGNKDPIAGDTIATLKPTRRILKGRPVGDTKPYMVYLRAAPSADNKPEDEMDWVCGGVIIHERYVLTSAACIEDVKRFYVISGTSKWVPVSDYDNECIKNGAKKAIWKCVPKSYVFDGDDFDNIRWMVGDIAVVKVDDPFNFVKRVRGCDFIPTKIAYNNQSAEHEQSRSYASIAGWGATDSFSDVFSSKSKRESHPVNAEELMEAEVRLISSANCKRQWEPRYHYVIDEHMVCTRDITEDETMSGICADREINCKELQYDNSNEYPDDDYRPSRRLVVEPGQLKVHTGHHYHDTRRKSSVPIGGFCENDHGGPLIVGQGKTSMVIGVMSACLTREPSKRCYGPFLYTSVYRYRNLISCAIDKDLGSTCRMSLRSSKTPMAETYFDWPKQKELTVRAFGHAEVENPSENITEQVVSGEGIPNAASPSVI